MRTLSTSAGSWHQTPRFAQTLLQCCACADAAGCRGEAKRDHPDKAAGAILPAGAGMHPRNASLVSPLCAARLGHQARTITAFPRRRPTCLCRLSSAGTQVLQVLFRGMRPLMTQTQHGSNQMPAPRERHAATPLCPLPHPRGLGPVVGAREVQRGERIELDGLNEDELKRKHRTKWPRRQPPRCTV